MATTRQELLETLESHYRRSGWRVRRSDDGTLLADGPGGVTWIGRPVLPEDLQEEGIEERFLQMAERRMDKGGELCPFELLPSSDCEQDLQDLLNRIGIAERSNVAVYSFAA